MDADDVDERTCQDGGHAWRLTVRADRTPCQCGQTIAVRTGVGEWIFEDAVPTPDNS